MQTMRDQIVARIERLGEGKAFSAKDFLDIASRTTIDVTLASLAADGKIRRIRRGLYDMPKINPALGGKLSPDIDEAARAIARRQRWKIVPDGAWAANLLGLSTQVPSKIIYLTDGPNNEVPIGRRSIHFKHARPKAMAGLEGKFALVVQALRHLGKDGVGSREIETLRAALSPAEKRKLVKDTRFGVDWIYEVAKTNRGEGGLNKIARMPATRARGIVRRNRGSQGLAGSHHRKGLLGLLDAEAAVLDRCPVGTAPLQGRHIAVENLSCHKPLLRRHRSGRGLRGARLHRRARPAAGGHLKNETRGDPRRHDGAVPAVHRR